ncbi:16S rRNA (cytosine(967)-C(5))-methyltransferase RsmB, partial [bacterium]|nr:16S rRNA (cytosine(967)-C(5))-methyltransferase RsmB [bacterium]
MPKPTTDAYLRGLLLAALNRLETRPQDAYTTVDQAVSVASELPGGRYTGLTNA